MGVACPLVVLRCLLYPTDARARVAGKAKEGISSKKEPTAEEQSKKMATSLILFEEVTSRGRCAAALCH